MKEELHLNRKLNYGVYKMHDITNKALEVAAEIFSEPADGMTFVMTKYAVKDIVIDELSKELEKVEKALAWYVGHVGACEGVDFLSSHWAHEEDKETVDFIKSIDKKYNGEV